MTFWQFVDKWVGKKADFDGYFGGQCVDLFRYYCEEVLDIEQPSGVWGAKNFWTNFESDPVLVANFTRILNDDDFTPLEGDVMVWKATPSNQFGHIGMCTGENKLTQYFKSFDQNWIKVSYCEIVNHSYKNTYGVLRPKKYIEESNMLLEFLGIDNEDEAVLKLIEHLGEKDGKCNWGQEPGKDKPNLGGYLGSARRKNTNYENEIINLEIAVQELGWKLQECETGNGNVPIVEEIEGYKDIKITTTQVQGDKEVIVEYKKRLI